jgi:hypothetical protein
MKYINNFNENETWENQLRERVYWVDFPNAPDTVIVFVQTFLKQIAEQEGYIIKKDLGNMIPTAEQAHLTAKTYNTESESKEYMLVKKVIEDAAKQGVYSTTISSLIKDDLKQKLESLGYTVNTHSDWREGSYTTIGWANVRE